MLERLFANADAVEKIVIGVVAVAAIAVIGGYEFTFSSGGLHLGKNA